MSNLNKCISTPRNLGVFYYFSFSIFLKYIFSTSVYFFVQFSQTCRFTFHFIDNSTLHIVYYMKQIFLKGVELMSNFFKKSLVILLLFTFLTAQLTFHTEAQKANIDNSAYDIRSESHAEEDLSENVINDNKKIKLNYVYLIEEKVEDLIPFYQNDYSNTKYGIMEQLLPTVVVSLVSL